MQFELDSLSESVKKKLASSKITVINMRKIIEDLKNGSPITLFLDIESEEESRALLIKSAEEFMKKKLDYIKNITGEDYVPG